MIVTQCIKRFKSVLVFKKNYFSTCNILASNYTHEGFNREVEELLNEDSEYSSIAESYFQLGKAHRCLIVQPYVKWGPKKLEITPKEQLEEAVALINTLPSWKVEETITVPLDNLDRKTLFKSGSMENLTNQIRINNNITSVFINVGSLKNIQSTTIQENFCKPVFDRYKIVMQILRQHATSKHARLQVALAELYYIQRKSEKDLLFGAHDSETLKLMFQSREQKLKNAIKELRDQRSLLRNRRKKLDYPVVAVVGYTNAGKTSLIKALTGEESLQPKNQLFATLDVTMHSGILPSGLEILYVDTVGFISDIPTNLIECFVATLEDAILADVILHVEDLSSSCFEYKRNEVLSTLKKLGLHSDSENVADKILSVGNKCDIVNDLKNTDCLAISAKTETGIDLLRLKLEEFILKTTSRKKITIKVPNGGDEIRWLYKNATVIAEIPDEKNNQIIKANVIISEANLQKFKHHFISS